MCPERDRPCLHSCHSRHLNQSRSKSFVIHQSSISLKFRLPPSLLHQSIINQLVVVTHSSLTHSLTQTSLTHSQPTHSLTHSSLTHSLLITHYSLLIAHYCPLLITHLLYCTVILITSKTNNKQSSLKPHSNLTHSNLTHSNLTHSLMGGHRSVGQSVSCASAASVTPLTDYHPYSSRTHSLTHTSLNSPSSQPASQPASVVFLPFFVVRSFAVRSFVCFFVRSFVRSLFVCCSWFVCSVSPLAVRLSLVLSESAVSGQSSGSRSAGWPVVPVGRSVCLQRHDTTRYDTTRHDTTR